MQLQSTKFRKLEELGSVMSQETMVMVKEEERKVMCTCDYRYTERNPFKCTFEYQNATEECVSLNFRKKKKKSCHFKTQGM